MNLVLIGYRCSGKSTVSQLLADILGWPVIHFDELIAATAKKTIVDLVRDGGWDAYREIERQVVQTTAQWDRRVIDPGGSIVMDARSVSALRMNGRTVWLKTSPSEILARMRGENFQRVPLTDAANAMEEVEEMVKRLAALHLEAADYIVETDGKTARQVAEEILRRY